MEITVEVRVSNLLYFEFITSDFISYGSKFCIFLGEPKGFLFKVLESSQLHAVESGNKLVDSYRTN